MEVTQISDRIIRVTGVENFDLVKTMRSGQSFRWSIRGDLVYCITGNSVTRLRQEPDGSLLVSATPEDWENVWRGYFDLDHDYSLSKFGKIPKTPLESKICYLGRGIHILKQDPWEVLVSFIITQNSQVNRARHIVAQLCNMFGKDVTNNTLGVRYKTFPTPQDILDHEQDIERLGIGYRDYYLQCAATCVSKRTVPLDTLGIFPDYRLVEVLQRINGVGEMIANSVALYAYQRRRCVPVDMWIDYALDNVFDRRISLYKYGELAGLMQQYIFYYVRQGGYLDGYK